MGATSLRRAREAALLKTLGLTRAGVLRLHAVEQALVGLVAGVLGAAGGTLLAWSVLNLVMELDWTPPPAALALAVGGSIALAVVAGGLAGGRALGSRPARLLAAE